MFQLGILILELITGQSSDQGDSDLVEWIQESCFRNSIYKMIDPDLGNDYDSTQLKKLLSLARLCLRAKDQPDFHLVQIFQYIKMTLEIPYQ